MPAYPNLVPAADVQSLRRMVAEPSEATYSDAVLRDIISRYPFQDAAGLGPSDTGWVPRYDLNAAAADVWDEKAGLAVSEASSGTVGGSVESVQVAGATFKLGGGSASATSNVIFAQERAAHYRRRIAPRMVRW